MLSETYKKKLKKYAADPSKRYMIICPYCKKDVQPDADAEYVKSRYTEKFFHRSCLAAELNKYPAQ